MTLAARIIPCLDMKDGRVVKGVNFVDLRDAGDPVEQATVYDRQNADEICFLDITASHEKRAIMLDVVRRTAECCFMPLTVGGGIKTVDDVRTLLLNGADRAAIQTAAVNDPDLIDACAGTPPRNASGPSRSASARPASPSTSARPAATTSMPPAGNWPPVRTPTLPRPRGGLATIRVGPWPPTTS